MQMEGCAKITDVVAPVIARCEGREEAGWTLAIEVCWSNPKSRSDIREYARHVRGRKVAVLEVSFDRREIKRQAALTRGRDLRKVVREAVLHRLHGTGTDFLTEVTEADSGGLLGPWRRAMEAKDAEKEARRRRLEQERAERELRRQRREARERIDRIAAEERLRVRREQERKGRREAEERACRAEEERAASAARRREDARRESARKAEGEGQRRAERCQSCRGPLPEPGLSHCDACAQRTARGWGR